MERLLEIVNRLSRSLVLVVFLSLSGKTNQWPVSTMN